MTISDFFILKLFFFSKQIVSTRLELPKLGGSKLVPTIYVLEQEYEHNCHAAALDGFSDGKLASSRENCFLERQFLIFVLIFLRIIDC